MLERPEREPPAGSTERVQKYVTLRAEVKGA